MRIFTSKKRPYKNLLIALEDGSWGEITPLPGRSKETIQDILESGLDKNKFPSAAFGLLPLPQEPLSWPVAALFMGSLPEIFARAEKMCDFTHAKLKVGSLPLAEGVHAATHLKDHFRLRIDFNNLWKKEDVLAFCQEFKPEDFDFLEDPGTDVSPFKSAADDENNRADFRVWKPSVLGIPKSSTNLILSSAYETGIGTARLVQLAHHLNLPQHPIGLGTYHYLEEDLLKKPLQFEKGKIYIPARLEPDLDSLKHLVF
ncbi:MAG: hypothetical protein JSR58_08190 [Verrucomicrobia bacterium]|nr:hypothetical protein [Verrucomicrobiota bacterium]